MIPDEIGKELHHKATCGEQLSSEERAQLDKWYSRLDAEEGAMLAAACARQSRKERVMSNKDLVTEALRQLPEDVTLEEISEEVAILAAIRRGEEDADAGRVIPHEELKKWKGPFPWISTSA